MRREFSTGDLTHLANLCHSCKGCYHSCQYAPPHPFGINVPETFATIRAERYAQYAWPPAMGRLYERNGTMVTLAAFLSVTLVLLLTMALRDPAILYSAQTGVGAFFRVIPYWLMTGMASLSFQKRFSTAGLCSTTPAAQGAGSAAFSALRSKARGRSGPSKVVQPVGGRW